MTLEPGPKAAGTGALRVGTWSRGSSLTVLEELQGVRMAGAEGAKGKEVDENVRSLG